MKTWEDEISEYGSLHNDDCCVNFPEDSRACDVGTGPMDCCENMRIIRTKIEEAEKRGEERARMKIAVETTCDRCGKEGFVGECEEGVLCQDCWSKTLSPEDIKNL